MLTRLHIMLKDRGLDLFRTCILASLLLHVSTVGAYLLDNMSFGNESVNSDSLNIQDAEFDFTDIPPELIGGTTNPAPVDKKDWVEGTDKNKNAKDAPDDDFDVNRLSGTGTDKDGYLYAFNGDRYPTPIIKFDLRRFFPGEARRANIRKKSVMVRIQVDENGKLNGARVVSPPSQYGFDDAAMKVIYAASFSPGYRQGKPVKMVHDIPIQFILE